MTAGEPIECFDPNAVVMKAEAMSRNERHVGARSPSAVRRYDTVLPECIEAIGSRPRATSSKPSSISPPR
jgi:hypothetical protein